MARKKNPKPNLVRTSKTSADFKALLDKTAGTWEGDDGLEYQKKIRAEWHLSRSRSPKLD